MLQDAHQLAANFVCLSFGTGQVANSGFIGLSCWKQLPADADERG